ncbi:hypothetical protein H4R35_006358 [Dimargaris xerosporica]|nr:hypothetical protein H4R35_006358 [Dimargaris xerosporica]
MALPTKPRGTESSEHSAQVSSDATPRCLLSQPFDIQWDVYKYLDYPSLIEFQLASKDTYRIASTLMKTKKHQPDPARFSKLGAPDLHLMLAAIGDSFFMLTSHHHNQLKIATKPSSAFKTWQTQTFHTQYPEFDLDPLPFKIRNTFKKQYIENVTFCFVLSPLNTIRSGLLGLINKNGTQEALVFINGYLDALKSPQLLAHFKTLVQPTADEASSNVPPVFKQIPYYSWENSPAQDVWPVAYGFWEDIVSQGDKDKLVFWLTDLLVYYATPPLIGALIQRRAFGETLTLLNGLIKLAPLTEWLEADQHRYIDYYELAMFLALYLGQPDDQELDEFLTEAQARLKADLAYLAKCPALYGLGWEQTARHHVILQGHPPMSERNDSIPLKSRCSTWYHKHTRMLILRDQKIYVQPVIAMVH